MQLNTTTIKTSSDGAWQGDNPLNYAFPLLIVQSTLVLFTSRFLAFLLKPLRQPKVIAEIAGGILLGPSVLGRNKSFLHLVFPSWSVPILESVASIGLLFFLFLVGLELDLSSIRRSGRKAFGIALAGISLPFLFAFGVTFLLRKVVHGEERVGYSQFLVFMGVALSITAFPVLARILAELKLLTTHVGETAMAAAAFNDVAAWILLALAVAVAGNGAGGGHKSPLISIWVLASGVVFVAFMLLVVRPMMSWVARQCSPEHDFVDEAYICLTLAGVMISGFMTDLIGIHSIFGAFVFGLTIPKGSEFATRLIKRIEDFVSGLLLPLYFASSGLKTDVAKIRGVEAWGLLVLVISTASAGKILGTFMVAMLCTIPVRESLALGVLMNTKGLVELIVLNIGKDKKVLNDEVFAILVLMALFTTFMTTPAVMAIYRQPHGGPTRRRLQRQTLPLPETGNDDKLRVLACIHGAKNVRSLVKLIDLTRKAKTNLSLKLYVLHLIEFTNRSSSIMMVQRARKNGVPFINSIYRGTMHDQVATAFQAYSQVGQITVRHSTAISGLSNMHEDIYHVAEEKRVSVIMLPFHKLWISGENEEAATVENAGHGWREVNRRVLESAPCTVAILIDRGLGSGSYRLQEADESTITVAPKRICIMFFGGPDDREVLELGGRMSEHETSTRVSFVRFFENPRTESNDIALWHSASTCRERRHLSPTSPVISRDEMETELDEAAVTEFQRRHDSVDYIEKRSSNIADEVLAIGRSGEYDLILVGKGRFPSNIQRRLADHHHHHEMEHEELGPVGDILARFDEGIVSSVLVVQQHGSASAELSEALAIRDKEAMIVDASIVEDAT
ncbi:hypothetical protein CDL15_Pgr020587 [Punica granatum]|uniref:Uncharacterized protein n=1 Tax=Punica granatum TaxID=22663 RepID=A0A218VX28_PUNGR|nr:hypothetical protein CDL15_Pgr020587 [Punica granatum]